MKMNLLDKRQLQIAKDTLKMPDAIVDVIGRPLIGGPNKKEALEIIKKLTLKYGPFNIQKNPSYKWELYDAFRNLKAAKELAATIRTKSGSPFPYLVDVKIMLNGEQPPGGLQYEVWVRYSEKNPVYKKSLTAKQLLDKHVLRVGKWKKKKVSKDFKKNPTLAVFGMNPRGRRTLSHRVFEIRYEHIQDGKAYKHEFNLSDVCMDVLPDGSLRIYHPRQRLWEDHK